jgi:DNA-binding transcriptional LysR family regulator
LSYPEAALTLGYTESAVHHQIATLQKAIGRPLFRKSGRGLLLTASGERALPHCTAALSEIRFVSEVGSDGPVQRIIVAGGTVTGAYILPNQIALFKKKNPGHDIELNIGRSDEVIHAVVTQDVHVGVTSAPIRNKESHLLTMIPWRSLDMNLYCSPQYITSGTVIHIYGVSTMSDSMAELLQSIRQVYTQEPIVTFLPSAEAVRNVALSGLGIAWLPTMLVQGDLETNLLKDAHIRGEYRTSRVQLWICHSNTILPPEVGRFVDCLMNASD